jgi:hypothetical protein
MLHFAQFKLILLTLLISQCSGAEGLSWIWSVKQSGHKERVLFRRDFEVPENVVSATLISSADNWHRLCVNGVFLEWNRDWQKIARVDINKNLKPGARNVIAVEAGNEGGPAGFVLLLQMVLADGKVMKLCSDGTWACSKEAPEGWEKPDFDSKTWAKAVEVEKIGGGPWSQIQFANNPAIGAEGGESKTPQPEDDVRLGK